MVSLNVEEGWSRDVSEAIAYKVRQIAQQDDVELTDGTLPLSRPISRRRCSRFCRSGEATRAAHVGSAPSQIASWATRADGELRWKAMNEELYDAIVDLKQSIDKQRADEHRLNESAKPYTDAEIDAYDMLYGDEKSRDLQKFRRTIKKSRQQGRQDLIELLQKMVENRVFKKRRDLIEMLRHYQTHARAIHKGRK